MGMYISSLKQSPSRTKRALPRDEESLTPEGQTRKATSAFQTPQHLRACLSAVSCGPKAQGFLSSPRPPSSHGRLDCRCYLPRLAMIVSRLDFLVLRLTGSNPTLEPRGGLDKNKLSTGIMSGVVASQGTQLLPQNCAILYCRNPTVDHGDGFLNPRERVALPSVIMVLSPASWRLAGKP